MKLLDYLEPMKTLPNRFSNLAFWRILRVLKDEVVDAFTYIHTWGTGIEKEQATQNDILTTHGNMLNSHENKISSLENEEISQNKRISALESSESGSSGKISTLEENVKTLNTALESVEKEQSTQNTDIGSLKSDVSGLTGDIEIIQGDQSTQDTNIAANASGITDLWKSIGSINTNLNTLNSLVYDSSTNFKITTATVAGATVSELFAGLYQINYNTNLFEFPSVPFHVECRASIFIYKDADKTNVVNIIVPVPCIITMGYNTSLSKNVTRIMINPVTFYAPYGVRNIYGVYYSYLSHV